jgi:hypothetical protein
MSYYAWKERFMNNCHFFWVIFYIGFLSVHVFCIGLEDMFVQVDMDGSCFLLLWDILYRCYEVTEIIINKKLFEDSTRMVSLSDGIMEPQYL